MQIISQRGSWACFIHDRVTIIFWFLTDIPFILHDQGRVLYFSCSYDGVWGTCHWPLEDWNDCERQRVESVDKSYYDFVHGIKHFTLYRDIDVY